MPDVADVPPGFLPLRPVPGRPEQYGRPLAEGSLYATFSPATRIAFLRVSVPRWVAGSPCNFPLVPLGGVDDIEPNALAKEVARAFRLPVGELTQDLERHVNLCMWAVTRVDFAVDLRVADPLLTLSGCRGFRRRHQGQVASWGNPVTTVQWASKQVCVQVYSKAAELRARSRSASASISDDLFEQAEKVVRFEVRLRRVRAIRDLFGLVSGLPVLRLVAHPTIASHAITHQIDRLRVYESYRAPVAGTVSQRARLIRSRLAEEIAHPSGALTRRSRLTPRRARTLAAVYFLASGNKGSEVADLLGVSPSSVSDALRDLEALGLAPDTSDTGNVGNAASEIFDQLEPYLLGEYPDYRTELSGKDVVVDPPWAHLLDDQENASVEDSNDADYVVAEDVLCESLGA